jgi:hypothetical protein
VIPFVGLALYAEGERDHRFLEGVTRRVVIEAFVAQGITAEVTEVQRLTVPDGAAGRAERILAGAKNEQGAFHILFIHADADADEQRAWHERVDPGRNAVLADLGTAQRAVVGIVPVRMTEAWALSDGDALREVLSTKRSDDELGLPAAAGQLEGLADPKAVLDAVVAAAHTVRRRRRVESGAAYLDRLAEMIRLDELRRLDAFKRFESDVHGALDHLDHLH